MVLQTPELVFQVPIRAFIGVLESGVVVDIGYV